MTKCNVSGCHQKVQQKILQSSLFKHRTIPCHTQISYPFDTHNIITLQSSIPLAGPRKACKEALKICIEEIARGLETLLNEIIAEPFNYHVALTWGHWFFINANDQGLIGLLHSNTPGALYHNEQG